MHDEVGFADPENQKIQGSNANRRNPMQRAARVRNAGNMIHELNVPGQMELK